MENVQLSRKQRRKLGWQSVPAAPSVPAVPGVHSVPAVPPVAVVPGVPPVPGVSPQPKGRAEVSAAERSRGFVKPVRRIYVHDKCGVKTNLSMDMAERFAADPNFYEGAFCDNCRQHFYFGQPGGSFHWDGGEKLGA